MSQQPMEPIEAARARARSLESTLDSVRPKATLATVFDALEDIDSQLLRDGDSPLTTCACLSEGGVHARQGRHVRHLGAGGSHR